MSQTNPEQPAIVSDNADDFNDALTNMCESMGMVEYSGGKTFLENFFRSKLARHFGVDPWDITDELLSKWEHQVEFDARPAPGTISDHLKFVTNREILERRARVEQILAEHAIEPDVLVE